MTDKVQQWIDENNYKEQLSLINDDGRFEYHDCIATSDLPELRALVKAELEEKFINEIEQAKEGTQKLIDNSSPLTVNVYKNQLATYQNAIRIFKSIKGVKR